MTANLPSHLHLIIDWIVRNVDSKVVPGDEGNSEALVYNLIHLALGDGKKYDYSREADAELAEYFSQAGIPYERIYSPEPGAA